MVRRIFAVLMALAVVFSLTIVSFADQTPEVYYNLMASLSTVAFNRSGSSVTNHNGDIIFDWDTYYVYAVYPTPYIGYTSSADDVLTITYSGYTDTGLSSPPVFPLYCVRYDNSSYNAYIESTYDSATGYFTVTYSSYDLLRLPFLRIQDVHDIASQCTFVSIRDVTVVVMNDAATSSSVIPIQALTASSELSGTVTLSNVSSVKSQRFTPVFSDPLQKGLTYLVSVGVTQLERGSGGSDGISDPILLSGIWNGSISSPGSAIPYTLSRAQSDLYSTTDAYINGGTGSFISSVFGSMPVTQTATFLYTPLADSSSPFTFEITSSAGDDTLWSANINVSALLVSGVSLDDVEENQSFAAWLNNKLDSIFGGIAARLNGIFDKQNQAYEDAADDAVDAGLAEAEQDHAREEELTNQAITNLDQSLDAVELPDLTQQQEINSGIGLLNTVIFDGFFGNPQMRFLLIFSLGMALAAVVLRLNH